ncbi:hypothetical protein B5C34_14745 [Pacificimonas flava]|uniref:DUF2855 domain-containing protein n=2 Tax=Pacificimonas TaxID=1960290 RepID=A0A219B0A9_9SPHN|nr:MULTISPECIES: DUF2855 family protein [Pacificimonas]MBZ6379779.1 DUF2855 family protein [Pacificimonas aurantium]OWV31767.1 hypothetical protein B5C34_14745 [Pacificimonas flava]
MSASSPPATVFGSRLLVSRADIASAKVDAAGEAPDPGEGRALFRVESAALTANNVTYAAMGEAMGYWRFFPAPEGYGTLPVWGFAECTASDVDGIETGDRFYGYWPLAEFLLVEADKVTANGFFDPSEHRQGLADAYNQYSRRERAADRAEDAAEAEAIEALFRPLFTTGWLIARAMHRAADYGAEQVVLSSASSKTAQSAAWTFGARGEGEDRPDLIGLTSPANADFTRATGLYDSVCTYDGLAEIAGDRPTVYIDFAGGTELRRQVHERFGPRLNRSIAVGATQWDEMRLGAEMPPPEPKMFFAPDAIDDEIRTFGRSGYAKELEDGWSAFADWVRPHISVRTVEGLDAAAEAYRDLAAGRVEGSSGLIVRP